MLKQEMMQSVLQDGTLPSSLNHSSLVQSWPIGDIPQMNWGQVPMGSHSSMGQKSLGKDLLILPSIQNTNNNAADEIGSTEVLDGIEMGRKSDPAQRIEYLEKSIKFLKAQHQELVTNLHEEVDRLKRKNKELQFCIVMMQQNMKPDKELSGVKNDSASTKRTVKKSSQSLRGIVQRNQKTVMNEVIENQPDNASLRSDPSADGTPRNGNTVSQLQGSEKLEELKILFVEEEIKELRKALECEQIQNQQLTELLRKSRQEKEATAAVAAASSDNLAENNSEHAAVGRGPTNVQQPSKTSRDIALPFGATLEPLMVHLPSQPARPPTLRECQAIARYLQQMNSRQAHELNQLKTDLRDVLYSHKWTPDAYLLARAYVTEDDAAEASQNRGLPRIPMKHSTKKLPDSAYAAQDSVTLPPLKAVVGNQAIQRQKRTQSLQKTKSAKWRF